MYALYGSGMHFWILDEALLGKRVAHYLDSENNAGWSALHDLSYQQYCQGQRVELMKFTVEIETTAPRSLVEHLLLTAVKVIGENLFPEGGGEDVTITLRDETRMLAMLNLTGDTAADLIAQDRAAWPNGHPCRDCGRLFVDHPTAQCQAWY